MTQRFYMTRLPDHTVLMLSSIAKLRAFAKAYLRHAYGVGTYQWLISTRKP